MRYMQKVWRKVKEKKTSFLTSLDSSSSEDLFDSSINAKFQRIREKYRANDFSETMSTNCTRFGKIWRKTKKKKDMNPDKMIPSDDCAALTNACFLFGDSSNVFSMFAETFLQGKNQDCLELVLSFLTCKELVASARTCKTLQHVIFEASDDEGNINTIWHGAEMELVKPHDRLLVGCCFKVVNKRKFGANAREHCRLFVAACTFAKACERSAEMFEIEEDRMMVDGVLTNLMNVRGFDAESIAEKKAWAEAAIGSDDDEDEDDADFYYYDDDSDDDEESGIDLESHDDDDSEDEDELVDDSDGDHDDDSDDFYDDDSDEHSDDDEEDEDPAIDLHILESHDDDDSEDELLEVLYERVLQHTETCKMFKKLTPPQKLYHHKVFVRITRASTGEVICQGFCEQQQKLSWNAGLDVPCCGPQGLEILLDFASLKQSDEVASFLESRSALVVDLDEVPSLGLLVTAVVVNEKDGSCQCLFQQDQSEDLELDRTPAVSRTVSRFGRPLKKHSFGLPATWSSDTVQLGPSPYSDQYFLDFSLSLSTDGSLVVPFLEVNVQKDTSNLMKAVLRQMATHFLAGEISEEMMNATIVAGIGILNL